MRLLSWPLTLVVSYRCQVVTVVAAALSLLSASPTYAQCAVVDLGTVPGDIVSIAWDINNRGDIVGSSSSRFGPTSFILWTRDGQINLATSFQGGRIAINDRGQVVGNVAAGFQEALRAFLWDKGVLTDLGTLPGHSSSVAGAINDRGDIAGVSFGFQTAHLVIWTDDVITDLGPLPGGAISGIVNGLNNRGQIVGMSLDFNFFLRPFVWEDGVFSELPLLPGGAEGRANDVNERGQIVGASSIGNDRFQAVLWDRGTVTILPTFPGSFSSIAWGINNRGQIVGSVITASFEERAVLWDKGTIIDLGPLPGGLATEINNAGTIVGTSSVPPFLQATAWTCR